MMPACTCLPGVVCHCLPQRHERAREWLAEADPALRSFAERRVRHHHVRWDIPAYEVMPGDRSVTDDIHEAEAFSSQFRDSAWLPTEGRHEVLVDVDVDAWLVPSSTPGHNHLYAQVSATWEDYVEWLQASAKIGLLEQGYVNACIERGMTSVRTPWTFKGEERGTDEPEVERCLFCLQTRDHHTEDGHCAREGYQGDHNTFTRELPF